MPKTMPDALDLDLDLLLLLTRQGVFVPLDDSTQSIGKAQGGWFQPVEKAVRRSANSPAGCTGIPFGVSGNLLHRRNDVLDKAGFPNPAATWEELKTQATRGQQAAAVWDWASRCRTSATATRRSACCNRIGGRIADDAGKTAPL